jgi:hypothetical protein
MNVLSKSWKISVIILLILTTTFIFKDDYIEFHLISGETRKITSLFNIQIINTEENLKLKNALFRLGLTGKSNKIIMMRLDKNILFFKQHYYSTEKSLYMDLYSKTSMTYNDSVLIDDTENMRISAEISDLWHEISK